MSKKNIAIVQMIICATMWSTGGIFMKLVPWHPMVLSGMRSLVAGITIAVFILASHQKFIFSKKTFLSGVALCSTYTFFVIANKLTTAANAIVLQFTAPVFIVLISVLFLHARFSNGDVAAVGLTLVGIAMFFFDQLTPGGLLGNIAGIMAGISMAFMYITNGKSANDERFSAIFIAQIMCFLIGVPFIGAGSLPAVNPVIVGSILFLGALQLGIPYILYGKAAEHCPPLACCLLGAIEPLLNPVWVFLFNGERPGQMALIGGAVVILTITVWTALSGRKAAAVEVAKCSSMS
ncbi:MAG: DMT family transporter [Oscillospiraceae bacterium]